MNHLTFKKVEDDKVIYEQEMTTTYTQEVVISQESIKELENKIKYLKQELVKQRELFDQAMLNIDN
jgi:hypothetical protein